MCAIRRIRNLQSAGGIDSTSYLINKPPRHSGRVFVALPERSLCSSPHAAAPLHAGRQHAERIGLDLLCKRKCLGGIVECVDELHGNDERNSNERRATAQRRRREGQEALLAAVEEALQTGCRELIDWAEHYDEPLCHAIAEWAASHAAPDGSQEWEDAFWAVAIPAASLRHSRGSAPSLAYRRYGALHTLRWLMTDFEACGFESRPGALDPDPRVSVEARAAMGVCVCYCRLPPCNALSEEDLALGGPPSGEQCDLGSGAVPFCRVHAGVRCAPLPLPSVERSVRRTRTVGLLIRCEYVLKSRAIYLPPLVHTYWNLDIMIHVHTREREHTCVKP